MNKKVEFLTTELVLQIHERMTQEFGGEQGVKDFGLLESAIAMPRQQFAGDYLHNSIPEMSAAYLFHICKNHPFFDGNKRTALATTEFFILMNEFELKAHHF